MQIQLATFLLTGLVSCAFGQRVVPGVNPGHYQQVPQQQQYQQQHPTPQHHYQQPQQQVPPGVAPQQYQQQQYQQVPMQGSPQQPQQQQQPQFQQQPPHQQVQQPPPPQQQQQHQQQQQQQQQQPHHGHHQQHGQQQVLNAGNLEHERAHIQEHMQVPIDTQKMSEAELQFHYFKMHDSDNNNKLDGCELIKSLIHWHAEDEHNEKKEAGEATEEKKETNYTDKTLEDIVEYVLKTMDKNNDGFVDYAEYRESEDGAIKHKTP